MKVLVTGAGGQLGWAVCKELERRGVPYRGTTPAELNITDAVETDAMMNSYQPDAVVHCAAYTKVDLAEDEPEKCWTVNADATRHLAKSCQHIGSKLLYISTDYVFSGEGDHCYEVDDPTEPRNVYGKSKLAGEAAVRETLSRYYIVRTSWMFGRGSGNFIEKLLRNAESGQALSMVADQFGSPTYTEDLAVLLCDMIQTDKFGVYHATNEGVCSRFDFAKEIFRQTWKDVELLPVQTSEQPTAAARPLNSRLSGKSLDAAGFQRLPDWHDALWRYLRKKDGLKKVLVTGGNGYIGKYVVKQLLDAGYPVMVAASHPEGVDKRARLCPEPIFSGADDIYRRMGSPDVCIHLAWKDGFVHNSPAHMANLSAHIQFCNDMMRGGLPILSCMGTMHEVGYWEGAIDESTPCNPQTQYGIAKNAMRQSLLLSVKNTGCVLHWLRLYYIVSDDPSGSNIFSKIIRAAQEGQKKFPFTSGKNLYDFMEIRQLARLIVTASLQTEIIGVTNVCTGRPESLADYIERFIWEHQLNIQLDYGKFPDRPYDSPGVWGDSKKIEKIQAEYVTGGSSNASAEI